MDANTTQVLNALAEKMGVAADYLWTALLKQAPVESTSDLIIGLVALPIAITVAYKLLRKGILIASNYETEGSGVVLSIASGIALLLSVIGECFFVSDLTNILAGFYNPEYWALHKVLSLLASHR